ncbi:unnamed protein product [Linum trigynum]|uniref:Stigma-specific Stig1 family protein n=1 Tax=Linum trigynum TaxID=586398 RepID=A0AAV2CDU7_9ROSI
MVAMALVLSINALPGPEDEEELQEDKEISANILTGSSEHVGNDGSLVVSRFLAQKRKMPAERLNWNEFPRICFARGSPGSHCCKKCVDVLKEHLNCGRCGNKCKYNETCCNGKCVNPFFNKPHCGGCDKSVCWQWQGEFLCVWALLLRLGQERWK